MPFIFTPFEISDVILIEARVFGDDRGLFSEMYKRSDFVTHGIRDRFVQDNCSHSVRKVLRGLHYQKRPQAQAKLVSVVQGEIFDVAVDIRKGSPTYGRWIGATLSANNHRMIYVPEGFAHGFCVLSAEADVWYKVSSEYSPDHERGIIWNDPDIGIAWPIREPLLSPTDARYPTLREADNHFSFQA